MLSIDHAIQSLNGTVSLLVFLERLIPIPPCKFCTAYPTLDTVLMTFEGTEPKRRHSFHFPRKAPVASAPIYLTPGGR